MNEVSCRAFAFFRSAHAAGCIDVDALCAGLGVRIADLDDPAQRMPWDVWVVLCERMARAVGTEEAMVQSARFGLGPPVTDDLGQLGSLLGTWADVYRLFYTWAAASLFRTMTFVVGTGETKRDTVTVDVRAQLGEGARASRAWMLLLEGSLAIVPRAFGHDAAPVQRISFDERSACWRVTLPADAIRAEKRDALELSSFGRVASGFAHEINNPLTYMLTNLWLVRDAFEQMPESAQRAEMLHVVDEINQGAHRIRDAVVRMTERARHAATSQDRPSPAASASLRIFVIDDDQLVLRALTRVLKPHHVVAFTEGARALEALLVEAPPDVVLCDVSMPGMSGIDLWERVAAERAELLERFVFVTGGALTERAERFLRDGGVRVLRKPVPTDELRAVIAERMTGRVRHA